MIHLMKMEEFLMDNRCYPWLSSSSLHLMNHHSCLVSVELAGFAVNLAADGDREAVERLGATRSPRNGIRTGPRVGDVGVHTVTPGYRRFR
jgi:hypothetical protein